MRKLVVISVPHPRSRRSIRQREMAWYQLFFLAEGIAEAWLRHDDWALFRELLRGDGDPERYIEDLSRPGALTASLDWYRANLELRPARPGARDAAGTGAELAIWSTGDHYLDGERVRNSDAFVEGPWRYEQIEGASHWIPLDAPDRTICSSSGSVPDGLDRGHGSCPCQRSLVAWWHGIRCLAGGDRWSGRR